ncbi:hypothetical protein JZ785_09265 [Alicyclobacillus curvatus]|jgi:hypothetical protein|nr:hypothetical protein JZ785_09265 [Alicyclobacillus curvatus]
MRSGGVGKKFAATLEPVRVAWPIFVVHVLFVLTAGVLWQHYFGTVSHTVTPKRFGTFIAGLSHWDAKWFLQVAKNGYVRSNPDMAAFFPLFPMTMGVMGHLLSSLAHLGSVGPHKPPGDRAYFLAGIAISNVSFFIALVGLYIVARQHRTPRQAARGLWLLALFPSSYYFSAAYSESMFLMLIVFAFVCAYKNRWLWAAILMGLAALCWDLGVFGIFSLLWLVWRDFRIHRRVMKFFGRALEVSVIPVALFSAYPLWLEHVFGNPLMFVWAEEHHWHRHFTFIWTSLHEDYYHDPLGLVASILFLAILLAATGRLPLEQWLFSAFVLLIPLFSSAGTYPMSMVRFVLMAFPLFLFVGASIRKVETYFAVIVACAVFMAWLTGLFASGHWIA